MEYEFMTIDTPLPPSMPLPRAMLRLPISSTAKSCTPVCWTMFWQMA